MESLEQIRRRQFVHRCLKIQHNLGPYSSPWDKFADVERQCLLPSGVLPVFENKAAALQFDFAELSDLREKQPDKFRHFIAICESESLSAIPHCNLSPFTPQFFLPTPAMPIGAIVGQCNSSTAILFENGFYEANSIGPIPDLIYLFRAALTKLLCPNEPHSTLCALLHPRDLCICQHNRIFDLSHLGLSGYL